MPYGSLMFFDLDPTNSILENWVFDGKPDSRTELEKVFYNNSTWEPPNAGKYNLTKCEFNFLKDLKENDDVIYKWEDKGPSFTKMTKNQYTEAGEKELETTKLYANRFNDESDEVKGRMTN